MKRIEAIIRKTKFEDVKEAHTGEIGDGRIFVSDILDTYSIRTGENGDTVLRDRK